MLNRSRKTKIRILTDFLLKSQKKQDVATLTLYCQKTEAENCQSRALHQEKRPFKNKGELNVF
jgi:hypothetical protein